MKKVTPIVILQLVLFMSLPALSIPQVNATEDSWTTKAPMRTARSFFEVVAVNGKIYAFGGGTNTTEEYDPETNIWTTKKPMPTLRSGFVVALFQNKIYLIGGEITDNGFTGLNEVYDPETDSWETKTSMPTKRDNPVANTIDDKIYVIGGILSPNLPETQLFQT